MFGSALAVFFPVPSVVEEVTETYIDCNRGDRGVVYDAHGNVVAKCVSAELQSGRCRVLREVQGQLTLCDVTRPAPLVFVRKQRG